MEGQHAPLVCPNTGHMGASTLAWDTARGIRKNKYKNKQTNRGIHASYKGRQTDNHYLRFSITAIIDVTANVIFLIVNVIVISKVITIIDIYIIKLLLF